ncbi:MAG: TIGR02757 family protein [Cryobacterium sp.]|nr:TIGR02757 family protein [Oligoflexia bacterium]
MGGLTLSNRIALKDVKNKRSVRLPLKNFIDPVFEKYHRSTYLNSDPLEFVHRFTDPWDQEAVALFSAVLAYGNVKQIRKSITDLLERIESLGLSPAAMIRSLKATSGRESFLRVIAGFIHRFNVGHDFYLFSRLISRSWERHGSFGAHLVSLVAIDDSDFGPGLSRAFLDWEAWGKEFSEAGEKSNRSFGYLITSPTDGSTCKRWCMLLRWMVRKDEIDLGLWATGSPLLPIGRMGLNPGQLVMPLDTHTGRISQYLGLTSRKSLNWKAAVEITHELRKCDPLDPVKYDFALCRLGILDLCQSRFRVEICQTCDLLRVCRFAQKGLSSRASRSTRS